MTQDTSQIPCPGCNGTGQMVYFGGVSRFQFSYTDCPECNGVGFLLSQQNAQLQAADIYKITSLSEKQAAAFLHALTQILSKTLEAGENIQLRGFGSFSLTRDNSSTGRSLLFRPSPKLLNSD